MYLCQSMRLSKQWFLNFCGSSSPKYLMKAITFSSERLIQSPHFEGSVCCRLKGCSALGEQAVLDCEQPEVTGPQVLPSSHFGGCYWAQMFLFLPNVGTKVIFFSADFNLIFFFFSKKVPKGALCFGANSRVLDLTQLGRRAKQNCFMQPVVPTSTTT